MSPLRLNLDYKIVLSQITDAMNNPVETMAIVAKVAFNAFKIYLLYNLYEAALSDVFCLKTFRHGTDPSAWLKIHLQGPDLNRGGTGGEARWFAVNQMQSPYARRDKGRHYTVQDYFERDSRLETIFSYFKNKGTLKYYALRSTVSYYGSWLLLPKSWKAEITRALVSTLENNSDCAILGLANPSIKMHLDPDCITYPHQPGYPKKSIKHTFYSDVDVKQSSNLTTAHLKVFGSVPQVGSFYNTSNNAKDESSEYKGNFSGACYTEDKLSVWDMGFCGIIKNGLNFSLPRRIWEHKGQFLWGIAQLVAAVAITIFLFPNVIPYCNSIEAVVNQISLNANSEARTIATIGSKLIYGLTPLFIAMQC